MFEAEFTGSDRLTNVKLNYTGNNMIPREECMNLCRSNTFVIQIPHGTYLCVHASKSVMRGLIWGEGLFEGGSSVRDLPSVRLSLRHVLCDKYKE